MFTILDALQFRDKDVYARAKGGINGWLMEKLCSTVVLVVISIGMVNFSDASDDKQFDAKQYFEIDTGDISSALTQLADLSQIEILFTPEVVEGKQSGSLKGVYTQDEALSTILSGTGLEYKEIEDDVYLVVGEGQQTYEGREVENIIVTAQKREQKLIDVPMSIVAIGEDELKARKLVTLDDLKFVAPGLQVVSNSFQRRIYMRGVSNSAGSSSQVGLYIDESAVTTGPGNNLDIQALDLERVEVLRGPQGTLYGEASQGGTIRFITKDPQLDRFGGRTNVSASFTDGGDPSQRIEGVLNIPLVDEALGLRVAASYDNTGGWIDQPAAFKEDINDEEKSHVRTKLLWRPTEQFEANAMATLHRNNSTLNIYEDDDGNYLFPFGLTLQPSRQDDFDLYNLTLTYDFAGARILSSSAYLEQTNKVRNMGYGYQLSEPPAPLRDTIFGILDNEYEVFRQELRINSAADGPLQWTVGAYYSDIKGTNLLDDYNGGSLAITYTIASNQKNESWAVFGNASYNLTDRLELGAGVRYFEDDRMQHNEPTLINDTPFGVATDQQETFDAVSPRLYANYKLTEDVNLYANIAKGFRSGGFNRYGQPPYGPETLWSYEFGTKMVFDRITADVAVYYIDYTDYVTRGLVPNGFLALQNFVHNAGDMDIKGVDWAFSWQATDRLNIGFNGNYVDTELVKLSVTNTQQLVGDEAWNIPDYQLVLSANYDFALAGRPGSIRLDYSQVGESSEVNRLLEANQPWLDGYTSDVIDILNFRVNWQWTESISVGVFAQNLLDERGYLTPPYHTASSSTSITGRTADFDSARPRPRTIGMEIGLEF